MISTWLLIACILSVLASTLVSGVFLAFSDFVMKSLRVERGIEVMQAINRTVMRSVFLVLLLGMAVSSLCLLGFAIWTLSGTTATFIMVGAMLYLVGVLAVTVFCNVPMNNRLAAMPAASAQAKTYWYNVYSSKWTRWNTVRTVAALAAAASYLGASVSVATTLTLVQLGA